MSPVKYPKLFPQANLSIKAKNGDLFGVISGDPNVLYSFLRAHDGDSTILNLSIFHAMDDELPEFINDPREVYAILQEWLSR